METRSCEGCIFFVKPAEAKDTAGKVFGASVCAKLKVALDRPDWDDRTRQVSLEQKAGACSEYTPASGYSAYQKKKAVTGEFLGFPGFIKVGSKNAAVVAEQFKPEEVTSCNNCSSFINQAQVGYATGWGTHGCAAKGALITGRNLTEIARNCEIRSLRTGGSATMTDLKLSDNLRRYPFDTSPYVEKPSSGDRLLNTEPESTPAPIVSKFTWIEPTEYPTDKPVTPEDEVEGIRAWRKMHNPQDQNIYTYLPIFDISRFSEEDQELIPRTGQDEHPELYQDYGHNVYTLSVLWMEMDETPVAWGEPGVGKTELFRHMAWLMCAPFERISIKETTEISELEGTTQLVMDPGTGTQITKFEYGRVPKAWSRACVMCVDEPNVGPPAVWHFLRPLTDNSKQLVIDAADSRIVKRHLFCFPGMAMNPDWDPRNEGANTIAAADRSRISHIYMELPPEKIEMQIIAQRVSLEGDWTLSDEHLRQMMVIAKTIRENCKSGAIPGNWGIRDQIKVAKALRWFQPAQAYRIAAADGYAPEVGQLILAAVNTTMSASRSPMKAHT